MIHYCWFGGKPMPGLAVKCIQSWRKYLPGWEIQLWNENNFDIDSTPYSSEAYRAGKYAFVSDYARFAIIEQYGGVYLDTDVELIKPWEPLIAQAPFVGTEQTGLVNPGVGFAMPTGNEFCKAMLEKYHSIRFLNTDGSFNLTTICDFSTEYFAAKGFVPSTDPAVIDGITILPPRVLSSKSQINGETVISPDTYSIHHCAGSWLTPWEQFKLKIKAIVGPALATRYINLKHRITNRLE